MGWLFTSTECQWSGSNSSTESIAFLGLLNSNGEQSWIVVFGFFCVTAYLFHQILNSQRQGPYYICLSFASALPSTSEYPIQPCAHTKCIRHSSLNYKKQKANSNWLKQKKGISWIKYLWITGINFGLRHDLIQVLKLDSNILNLSLGLSKFASFS